MQSVTDQVDPRQIVWQIASFGLEGRDCASPPLVIEEQMWGQVLGQLNQERITGFAVAGVEAERLHVSTKQADELLEAHRHAMMGPLAVERGLLEIAAAFEAGDIEFVVLKGPALAHTVYPDPSWRAFGDLDLLVHGDDWVRVSRILESLGYRRNLPEPRAGFDRRFGKASEFRRPGGIEVDLHRTLVVGPFGLWIQPEVLFERTMQLRLWGGTFKRLDDTLLQLHACVHASLGWWPPLMMPSRDVVQVAHYGQVDWDALLDRAARWKLRAVVRHALQMSSETLGVGLPPGAQAGLTQKPTRKEQRALQSYVNGRRNLGGIEVGTLRAIRGFRAKAGYVRALMFPNREFLTARSGGQRVSYRHRWAVPIRWLRGRRRARR